MNMTTKLLPAVMMLAASSVLFLSCRGEPLDNDTYGMGSGSVCMIGEIKMWVGDKIPKNWLPCDGREINLASNQPGVQALYSVIGNAFGGDGKLLFNLPDLRKRVPVGATNWKNSRWPRPPMEAEIGKTGGKGVVPVEGMGMRHAKVAPVESRELFPVLVKGPHAGSVDLRQASAGVQYILCAQGVYPQRS